LHPGRLRSYRVIWTADQCCRRPAWPGLRMCQSAVRRKPATSKPMAWAESDTRETRATRARGRNVWISRESPFGESRFGLCAARTSVQCLHPAAPGIQSGKSPTYVPQVRSPPAALDAPGSFIVMTTITISHCNESRSYLWNEHTPPQGQAARHQAAQEPLHGPAAPHTSVLEVSHWNDLQRAGRRRKPRPCGLHARPG
jgi:hypothetical protein